MITTIKKDTVAFLKDLKAHNNRNWFNANKERYLSANENFIQVVQAMIMEIYTFDDSVRGADARKCVFRIYRDIRFAKDKSPYKTNFGAVLTGKGRDSALYYFHLSPSNSFLAGGIHQPESKVIRAVRREISRNGREFLKIIGERKFKEHLELTGEKLSRVPQGFERDDPMAEYLKFKEILVHHRLSEKQILSSDLVSHSGKVFRAMLPFNEFLRRPTAD